MPRKGKDSPHVTCTGRRNIVTGISTQVPSFMKHSAQEINFIAFIL